MLITSLKFKTLISLYIKNLIPQKKTFNIPNNLMRWGGALLELSQFQNVPDSKKMILVPGKRLYFSCIYNARTGGAKEYFNKAALYFKQAVDEEHSNELYQKSLEVAAKCFGYF
ncbi:hypothetical protein ACOSQ3_007402 [Xanthoceras sorbifolium]